MAEKVELLLQISETEVKLTCIEEALSNICFDCTAEKQEVFIQFLKQQFEDCGHECEEVHSHLESYKTEPEYVELFVECELLKVQYSDVSILMEKLIVSAAASGKSVCEQLPAEVPSFPSEESAVNVKRVPRACPSPYISVPIPTRGMGTAPFVLQSDCNDEPCELLISNLTASGIEADILSSESRSIIEIRSLLASSMEQYVLCSISREQLKTLLIVTKLVSHLQTLCVCHQGFYSFMDDEEDRTPQPMTVRVRVRKPPDPGQAAPGPSPMNPSMRVSLGLSMVGRQAQPKELSPLPGSMFALEAKSLYTSFHPCVDAATNGTKFQHHASEARRRREEHAVTCSHHSIDQGTDQCERGSR